VTPGSSQWDGTYIRCTKHYSARPFSKIALRGGLVGTRVKGLRAYFPTTSGEVERETVATDDPSCLRTNPLGGRPFEDLESDWFLPAETVHPMVIATLKCDRVAGSFKHGYHSHCHATRGWTDSNAKAEWDTDVFLLPI
jgi:hypothetical protein